MFALLGLGTISFALIGLIECGFVLYYRVTGRTEQYVPDLGIGVRSWTVHHAMRPMYEGPGDPREKEERPITTNSLGLRDVEPALPKPDGVYRVLFLGDSFTFGWKVMRDESFVRVCASMLGLDDGRVLDVVNGGVASYCPLLSYLQFRHHLHVLEPDLVVINFDMSDVQDTYFYSPTVGYDENGTPMYCREESLGERPKTTVTLRSLAWLGRRFAPAAMGPNPLEDPNPTIDNGVRGRYLWTLDDGPTWEAEARAAFAPIAHLADLLEPRGIALVVATYPYSWQVSATATPVRLRDPLMVGEKVHRNDRPFEMLGAFASDRGLPFVNATERFRAQPDIDSLYYDDDLHWTAAGHRVYGEYLAAELARLVEPLQLR